MKIQRMAILLSLATALSVQPACSVGRRMVPQSDIDAYEIGKPAYSMKILLASRNSDFKIELARLIGESLKDDPVYVKFIGIDRLDGEDTAEYTAIIVMAKCIAEGMDPTMESFLKMNAGMTNIVLLVTSGGGDWKPDMEGMKFDAITSASVMEDASDIAEEILEKVRAIIRAQG